MAKIKRDRITALAGAKRPAALAATLLASQLMALPAAKAADDAAALYRGKTIQIDVGAGAGGGYDANARLTAAHLGKFIPGAPKIVVVNMPGGGGLRAANELYAAARRDGTVLSTFSNAMITEPLLGTGQALFKPQALTWIGSASHEDGVCVAAARSGVRRWPDVLKTQIVAGAAAPGTTTSMYPYMLDALFDAKFKVVGGYPDAGQIALALERGEVQAVCQTWSSLKSRHADWLRSGLVVPIVALSFKRIADLPNVPSIMEMAKSDRQRQALKLILAPTLAGRPFAAPPGVPDAAKRILRQAFSAMVADPAYVAAAKRSRMDLDPVGGAEIEALVKEIYALPAKSIADARQAVASRSQ